MRVANTTTTGIAVALWLGMFLMGRDLAYGFYSHGAGVFPSAEQIDYYVLFPVAVVFCLTLLAWISNIFRRRPALLLAGSMASILILLPYLFFYTGGV
jgi:hypothetical protein